MNFPFRTAFVALPRFWTILFFIFICFQVINFSSLISLGIPWLCSSIVSNLHMFMFFSFLLIVDFYSIVLWSERMLDMISVFLDLLSLLLWPCMLCILKNVLCALEKTVFCFQMKCSFNVSFKFSVFLLVFCLDYLSIDVNVMLKSPNIILLLSVSPFRSVSVCLMY